MKQINNYINHIVFVIDKSGSMAALSKQVIDVFDTQIQYLAQRSKDLDQETRVSVYLFDREPECLVYDKDVLRLPSLRGIYKTGGSTGLIKATLKSISDLAKTPQLYGDHSFLIYVLTDGQNTDENYLSHDLNKQINNLPENWTIAVLVPDQLCAREAKQFGFPANNVQVWSTNNEGMVEVGEVIKQTTGAYMQARATGMRGTKSLFNLNTSNLNTRAVNSNLKELGPSEYVLLNVHKDSVIRDFVESWMGGRYVIGSAYYQLTKSEAVQNHKQICIQNKINGRVYSGSNARKILGLPDYEVKVGPSFNTDYDIFVQSTSTNRKLIAGTKLIVLK